MSTIKTSAEEIVSTVCNILSGCDQPYIERTKLTPEQSQLVADNHNLIYWYLNMRHLNEADWYDMLAIELCQAVMFYNPEKGAISTIFKQRADWMINREWTKSKTQKRDCVSVRFTEGVHDSECPTNVEEFMAIKDWIDSDDTGILQLKSEGFKNKEIAKMLGITPNTVYRILKKKKEEFTLDRRMETY